MALLGPKIRPFRHYSEITDCPRGRGGLCVKCGPQHEGGLGSAGECWGASWWPPVHTAAARPRLPRCCSTSRVIYGIWFAAVSYLWFVNKLEWASGRGQGGDRGMLERKVTHLPPLRGAERVTCHWSSVISTLPGHLGGRKTANWWQPWNKHLKRVGVVGLFFF